MNRSLMKYFILSSLVLMKVSSLGHFLSRFKFSRNLEVSEFPCNTDLMNMYGLKTTEAENKENIMCPMVSKNCCSREHQIYLYNTWAKGHERAQILTTYKSYMSIFDEIFSKFSKINTLAETFLLSENNPVKICHKFAKGIVGTNIETMKPLFLAAIKKSFKFLYESHRGFYCTLCDAKQHSYYRHKRHLIKMSYGFCKKLLSNSMNYLLFYHKDFMKISRIFSEYVASCGEGVYFNNKPLKHSMKIFSDNSATEKLEKCANSPDSQIMNCIDICEEYHPTKFSQFLEGNITKLISFDYSLGRMLKRLEQKNLGQNNGEMENGRILESDEEIPEEPSKNPFNEFNKEYSTNLVNPIVAENKEKLFSKHFVNYDISLFKTFDKISNYNIFDYSVKYYKNGIDYHVYGMKSYLNKEGLDSIIQELVQQKRLDEADNVN